MVRSEMEKYRYSIDDLNKLYSNLRTIASDADDSLVVVHSIQHEKDWFDNPIETSGDVYKRQSYDIIKHLYTGKHSHRLPQSGDTRIP